MLQEGVPGSAVLGSPTLPHPWGGDPPGPPSTIGSVMPGRGPDESLRSDAKVQSPPEPQQCRRPLPCGKSPLKTFRACAVILEVATRCQHEAT